MSKADVPSYVKGRKLWSKRYRLPGDQSDVLQVSAKQLARGWTKTNWHGFDFKLEPQSVSSYTKEGSRQAAARWVEYVTAVIDGTSGKAVNQVDLLKERVAELEAEMEAMRDPAIDEQNSVEISEAKDEIRMRRFAEQQGRDFDEVRAKRLEAAKLLQAHVEEDWDVQKRLLLPDLDRDPQPDDKLLTHWRDQYLQLKRSDNQRSIGRYDNVQRIVSEFVQYIGTSATVDHVTEATWQNWYLKVLESKSTYTQRDLLSASKAFVQFLYEQRQIELPRNLRSLKVSVEESAIQHYTLEELRLILREAPGILQCFVYLMANCGFYQGDIATLTPGMLQSGYVTRQRSKKSRKGKNIPTVSWKLWSETADLVERYRTDEGGLLFTNEGKSWKVMKQKHDGKISKHDAIRDLWKPFAKQYNVRLAPKYIRKTAANALRGDDSDKTNRISLQIKFLGQTPSGTAMRHYIDPAQEELDRAVDRLRVLLLEPKSAI